MTTSTHVLAALLALASPLAAQQILNLDARTTTQATPAVLTLGPGLWRVIPIDPSSGGSFTAWHPWNGVNSGCSAVPGACTQGWMWNYFVQCPQMPFVKVGAVFAGIGAPKFATADEAFATADEHWFPLTTTTTVSFWIGDSSHADNLGGVALRIESASPTYPTLTTGSSSIALATGGSQTLDFDGGAIRAGHLYLVLGSTSGSAPGFSANHWHLPLNFPDAYLGLTLQSPNSAIHVNTLGSLDATGRGRARIVIPAGLDPSLAGLSFWHSVITLRGHGISGISAASRLDLIR
ncbi:MAG: hypothetical protein AB7I19_10415 [Planctomycetota bacterium]